MKKRDKPKEGYIKSGIPGLDELLNNGFKKNSSILIAGSIGCGKSVFALQFAIEGAKNGQSTLYIATEEKAEAIRYYARTLGFNIEELEKKGTFYILDQIPIRGNFITLEAPLKLIRQKKIKRVVVDSLTLFEHIYPGGQEEYRKGLIQFLIDMKENDATLLAVSERSFRTLDNLQYKPEDSVFDAMIVLIKIRKAANFERCITIEKIRGQDHMLGIYPLKIEKYGMRVFPKEIPFSLIEEEQLSKK